MKKGKNCLIYKNVEIFSNVILGENVSIFPGAVIGRPPKSSGATQRVVDISELPPTIIGNNCVIGCNTVIYLSLIHI